jgi:hypothetical protein
MTTIKPCPYCDKSTGIRIYSALAAAAFGEPRGSVHESCEEQIVVTLRGLGSNPVLWPAAIQHLVKYGAWP